MPAWRALIDYRLMQLEKGQQRNDAYGVGTLLTLFTALAGYILTHAR